MVVIFVAVHPIFNLINGIICFTGGFSLSFKVTKFLLKGCDANQYKTVKINSTIKIIDDDYDNKNSIVTFNRVVKFKKIPNRDNYQTCKGNLWYNSDDFNRFKHSSYQEEINKSLQEMTDKQA